MSSSNLVPAGQLIQPIQKSSHEAATSTRRTASRLGFWVAILAVLSAAVALGIGIVTPPRTGHNCLSSCITYPYSDAAAFVPGDFFWMVPAIFMAIAFLVLMACLYSVARSEHEVFGRIGVSFALITTAVITTDYFVQLSVVQPSLLKGETEGLALITQYNPHGLFIALEDLGYLTMSLAFLCASAVFARTGKLDRAVRWLYILAPVLAIGSFVVLSVMYGLDLDYRFEVLAIAINWITLIISGILLSIWFRRGERKELAGWH